MAKDRQAETVEVPVATLQALQARLDQLEARERLREEAALRPTKILDAAWEALKAELARPANVRTQDEADRRYGKESPRFRCRLDSSDGGRPGPKIDEVFALEVSASSDLEAGARYLLLMGITKHDYRLVTEPVA